MAVRPPSFSQSTRVESGANILDYEIQEERAHALARLNDPQALAAEEREVLLKAAAYEVWKFFIQRESCGIRDHRPVIEHYGIPRAVIVRLGAR